jgi:O-antigen/teichoic acid export membrane protein
VQFGLIFVLVKFGGYGLTGVLLGTVAGLAAVVVVATLLLSRGVCWTLDWRLLSRMVSYGLAMIPVFLSGWIINLSDRFFLKALAGLGALGVYSLGYKFGMLVDILLVMPFQRAWSPLFLGMAADEAAPRRLARVTTYLCAGLMFFTVAISLAVPPFLRFSATRAFHAAAGVVPIICVAYLIGGLANCLGNGLVVSGNVRSLGILAAAAAAINLVLNALLIPPLGMYGAAMATALSLGLQFTGIVSTLTKRYPVPIEWGRLLGLGLAGLVSLGASSALPELPLPLDVAARAGLLVVYPLLVLLLRLPRADELARARSILSAWAGLARGRQLL